MIMNPAAPQVLAFAKAIHDDVCTLTDDLREAIATLNAVCARKHAGKDPRPNQPSEPEYA